MDGGTARAKSQRAVALLGGIVFMLAPTGCSKAPAGSGSEAPETPTITTAVIQPVPTNIPSSVAEDDPSPPAPITTSSLPPLPPPTTTTAPPATPVVVEDDAGSAPAEAPEVPNEDFTTDDLDSLLDELDDIFSDLDTSLTEEEGEMLNG